MMINAALATKVKMLPTDSPTNNFFLVGLKSNPRLSLQDLVFLGNGLPPGPVWGVASCVMVVVGADIIL